VSELGLERGGAGGGAEPAALERLLAEQFGEPVFELADVLGEPPVLLVQVGILGQPRAGPNSASRRACRKGSS
jgi:hypothetical protein